MTHTWRTNGRRATRGILLATAFLTGLKDAHAIKQKPSHEARDHPAVVLITARSSRGPEVGKSSGVLIAPNAVLTAAHGMDRFEAWEVTAPYARNGPARSRAKTFRVHPDFKPGVSEYDVAVLILTDPIDLGGKFPTLHGGDLYPIDTKLLVVGRVQNGSLSGTQLFQAPVTLARFPGNTNLYGGVPHVVEQGDSGGPLFVRGKEGEIAGLVSGHLGPSRGNVQTDCFIPISRRNKAWILRQVPAPEK